MITFISTLLLVLSIIILLKDIVKLFIMFKSDIPMTFGRHTQLIDALALSYIITVLICGIL